MGRARALARALQRTLDLDIDVVCVVEVVDRVDRTLADDVRHRLGYLLAVGALEGGHPDLSDQPVEGGEELLGGLAAHAEIVSQVDAHVVRGLIAHNRAFLPVF